MKGILAGFLTIILTQASWYSTEACKFNSDPACPTASGKSLYALEAEGALFAASYQFPLGSMVRVTNQGNGKQVVVRIEDRGPNKRLKGRLLDLGKHAFKQIADERMGLATVSTELI